jgi:hypothetical protein
LTARGDDLLADVDRRPVEVVGQRVDEEVRHEDAGVEAAHQATIPTLVDSVN